MVKSAVAIVFFLTFFSANDPFKMPHDGWVASLGSTNHLTSKMACFADRTLCKENNLAVTKNKNASFNGSLNACQKAYKKLRKKIQRLETELINLKNKISKY